MARARGIQQYTENNEVYVFNSDKFNEVFLNYYYKQQKKHKKYTKEKCYVDMMEFKGLRYSRDAFIKWRFGKSAPGGLGEVKALANFFGLESKDLLLKLEMSDDQTSTAEDDSKTVLSEKQIESVKRLSDAFLDFLYEAETTQFKWVSDGNGQITELDERGTILYSNFRQKNVNLVLKQEAFYLSNTEIYVELEDFFYDYISDDKWDDKYWYYDYEPSPDEDPDFWERRVSKMDPDGESDFTEGTEGLWYEPSEAELEAEENFDPDEAFRIMEESMALRKNTYELYNIRGASQLMEIIKKYI